MEIKNKFGKNFNLLISSVEALLTFSIKIKFNICSFFICSLHVFEVEAFVDAGGFVSVDVVGAGSGCVFSLKSFSVSFLVLQRAVPVKSHLGRVHGLRVDLYSLNQVSTDFS